MKFVDIISSFKRLSSSSTKGMTRTQTSCTIVFPPIEENLSKDVITEILKHISDVPMLCSLRCLNKNFRKLVDQDVIWENLLIRENLFSPDIKREKPLKDVYADLTCYRFDPTLTQARDGDGNNWVTWDENHIRATNRGKWRVNVALRTPIFKGQHYYEFTVQNDTNIGIVTREFLENTDAAQEIGSNNTYSFGYAMTGNLAICGKWLRGKCERHKATTSMCDIFTTMLMGVLSDSSVIIGMLVDLDNGYIQYWKDGVLQGACAYIYDRSEIKDLPNHIKEKKHAGFYVTTTLYNNLSSVEINRPPKYPLHTLAKYDKPPNPRLDWTNAANELCY